MPRVNTMDFSTPDWTRPRFDPARAQPRVHRFASTLRDWGRKRYVWLIWALCAVLWAGGLAPARAADLTQLGLSRNSEGLFLSATVNVVLAPSMEDALARSVPLYFVVQADVLRERWYWSDKRVAGASRTYRLAYQPLSRHWRVSVASGSGPGGALQYALHQNHDSLAAALSSITKLSGWQVAEAARLDGESDLVLEFRFKLDLALLPRPFQLGMNALSEWNLDVRRRMGVPEVSAAIPVPVDAAVDNKPDAVPSSAAQGAAGKAP